MKKSNSPNNYFVCPNCKSLIANHDSKSSNKLLEKNFDYFTNSLYSNIKLFYKKISIIINNIKNITTGLENQTIHSKSLIKLIVVKNNKYIERYHQLSDRIDMINESKKILDYNLSLANENLNIFVNDINQIFKKMKTKFSQTNNININNSGELRKNIINLNQSPKKILNSNNNNKFLYRNFENFVNNINFDDYNQNNNKGKSNNTLIFPNNINQNIFNYTITSREFQKMKNGQNLRFFNNNLSNKINPQSIDNKENNNYQNTVNKLARSSSLPDMNKKNIQNNRYQTYDYDYNDIIQLCYKVKDFFDYLNNNTIEESDILLNKIKEINILINVFLDNNRIKKNILVNENYNNINENNKELIKNIEILTKKINDLEIKIKEKDEYIKYIKKNINRNDSDKKIFQKENEDIKNELTKLSDLSKENQNMKKEIEDLIFKNKELNNLLEKNNSLKLEINQKEEIITKLKETINKFEEKDKNTEKENNELNEKNEEFKENLKEKNKIIQENNTQIDKYKNEINELNKKLEHVSDESQLIMEITSLKKINGNLNKKINDMKKKQNPNSNSNVNSSKENDFDIIFLKEKHQELTEENKKLKIEKENLKIENNQKEEEIKKLNNEIDELNKKMNEKDMNKKINSNNLSESDSSSMSKNSMSFDIVNINQPNSSNLNIDDFKKQNEKLIKLKEMFDKYKNEKQIEISIYKNEFEESKKEIEELKLKLTDNNNKIYSSENYNILCDKNYKNLQWFLLIPKSKSFSKTYEDLIWVPRKRILNIENFNNFESEYEAQNKIIADNLFKLAKKEEKISKLEYKINCYEKNLNSSNEISNNNMDISSIGIDKMNKILNQLNEAEKMLKIAQDENKQLKEELSKKTKTHKNKIEKPNSTEESNQLAYNKKYKIVVKSDNSNENNINNENNMNKINIKENENENEEEENEEEGDEEDGEESDSVSSELRYELENTKIELDRITNAYKDLENRFNSLKDSFSNLLIRMKIPKKYKADMTEILKLLEFSDNEILFIIDKKKLY